ncbi:MAG: DNA-binding protein [Candidatus Bathyarchaeia archaeon]
MSPTKPVSECRKLKVILDSNALFASLQFRIDIFTELKTVLNRSFEPVLLFQVKKELERIAAEKSPKKRREAAYALKMAEKCKLVKLDEEFAGSPDEAIVKAASEWRCPVFTNDKELRKRLRDISVPVIYVRQKSRLEIDGRV